MHHSISQTKHQLDATLCRFYFCRVTLHVSDVKRPSSGVFKTSTAATGTCVSVVGQSSHLLIRAGTQCHSTCFGRKRPSSGVFKTSTAATGTCVIVVGQSSHLLIRAVPALIRRCND